MNHDTYNDFCASLLATTHVVQWGGAHVWKVGGKVFAIAGWSDREQPHIVFKCSDLTFEILKEQEGYRPAPYLAPRGGKWIQAYDFEIVTLSDIQTYLKESHHIISQKLTKKLQAELGIKRD